MIRHRLEFSAATKREALERSGGVCECHLIPGLPTFRSGCGCRLGAGNTFYEHVIQDAIRQDNSLGNCAVLVRTCWKLKTATIDLPVIADGKRQRDRHFGIKPRWHRPLPGGRDDPRRRTMRGQVVSRATGEPWRGR